MHQLSWSSHPDLVGHGALGHGALGSTGETLTSVQVSEISKSKHFPQVFTAGLMLKKESFFSSPAAAALVGRRILAVIETLAAADV